MSEFFYDSQEAQDQLVTAGFSEDQAGAVADTLRGARSGLATKANIRDVRRDIKDTRTEIKDVRTDVRGLRGAVTSVENRLDRFEKLTDQRFALVHEKLDVLGARSLEQKTDIRTLEQRTADMSLMMADMKINIADTRAGMVTKQDLKSESARDRWVFSILWGLMLASNAVLYGILR